MASPTSPTRSVPSAPGRRRATTISSIAEAVVSTSQDALSLATHDLTTQNALVSFWSAAAVSAARAPTISEIRRQSYGTDGWQMSSEQTRRCSLVVEGRPALDERPIQTIQAHGSKLCGSQGCIAEQLQVPGVIEELQDDDQKGHKSSTARTIEVGVASINESQCSSAVTALPWIKSIAIGFKAFLKWTLTPFGMFLILYSLNVVAWGGMLFLLLCNAAPAMCWAPQPSAESGIHRSPAASLQWLSTQPRVFDCSDINSPRRIWLEIDSQILNALFCVTGFGLIPWRLRDLYFILSYHCTMNRAGPERKLYGLRVLAGVYQTWFRLPGSSTIDHVPLVEYAQSLGYSSEGLRSDIREPLPDDRVAAKTSTGRRAPATAVWKLDFFVACNICNTMCCRRSWRHPGFSGGTKGKDV